MILPPLRDLDLPDKTVLVRADLDIPLEDHSRLNSLLETLNYLQLSPAKIILIGHRGRPQGKPDNQFSLLPIAEILQALLQKDIKFVFDINPSQIKASLTHLAPGQTVLLENLRFYPGEEANDPEFAKNLAFLGDFYVNEAFAASHRPHASIVGLPKLLPHAAGFHFAQEVAHLSQVLENPKRPLIVIVSGAKPDKLNYLQVFKKFADKILIAGRLPEYYQGSSDNQLTIATLAPDKLDITEGSITEFKNHIATAGTIVVSGPIGKFEDPVHEHGTKEILETVVASSAFKVAGGGDTQAAIAQYHLTDKFDWISTGGGAMLEFLSTGTLPGIQALLD